MRFFNKLLASSVTFTGTTPAFSTSGSIGPQGTPSSAGVTGSISFFGSPGSQGGPTRVAYDTGLCLQGLFTATPSIAGSSGGLGTFMMIASNTPEASTMTTISSSAIATTGSFMFRDSAPWYQYVDFKFIPNSSYSSTGFLTVNLSVRGISG